MMLIIEVGYGYLMSYICGCLLRMLCLIGYEHSRMGIIRKREDHPEGPWSWARKSVSRSPS